MNRRERRAEFLSRHRQTDAGDSNAGAAAARAQRANNVRLHVGELVLHGFAARDRHVIGDAVRQELTRLIVERGLPAQLIERRHAAQIDGGSFQVEGEFKTRAVGAQIAGAVYGGARR